MIRFPDLIGIGKFAQGHLTYVDRFGTDTPNTRIVLTAEFGYSVVRQAILDTGALWCILAPDDASGIDLRYIEPLLREVLWIRGTRYEGQLYRIPITLFDEGSGSDLTIEATVFIPTLAEGEQWLHPNFLGLDGFLHRLRFAVDSEENSFYFGVPEG